MPKKKIEAGQEAEGLASLLCFYYELGRDGKNFRSPTSKELLNARDSAYFDAAMGVAGRVVAVLRRVMGAPENPAEAFNAFIGSVKKSYDQLEEGLTNLLVGRR